MAENKFINMVQRGDLPPWETLEQALAKASDLFSLEAISNLRREERWSERYNFISYLPGSNPLALAAVVSEAGKVMEKVGLISDVKSRESQRQFISSLIDREEREEDE